MTLYHFGNCLALLYAPYHMAYKYSGISEYGSFSRVLHAGALYVLTQLCKMLLLATFFPDADGAAAGGEYNVFLEILKATVDYADLVGLHFALNSVSGKGNAKILTAAIGWASAEVVVTMCVPLWSGARGAEFSWRYLLGAAGGAGALPAAAAAAALLWLRARTDLPPAARPLLLLLLLLTPYRSLLEDGLVRLLCGGGAAGAGAGAGAAAVALRAASGAANALAALALYAAVAEQLA